MGAGFDFIFLFTFKKVFSNQKWIVPVYLLSEPGITENLQVYRSIIDSGRWLAAGQARDRVSWLANEAIYLVQILRGTPLCHAP